MTSKTLCPIPWNHLGIQQNGDIRQCCQMIENPYGKIIDDGVAAKFDPATVEALRSFKSLRRSMMVGAKSAACE